MRSPGSGRCSSRIPWLRSATFATPCGRRATEHRGLATQARQRVADRAETIVEGFLERPEEYDEPTCGPGPFSMANADTVTDVLTHADRGPRAQAPRPSDQDRREPGPRVDLVMSSAPPARSCGCGAIGPTRSAPRSGRRCSRAWPTWSAMTPSTPGPQPGPCAPSLRSSASINTRRRAAACYGRSPERASSARDGRRCRHAPASAA